MNTKKIYIRSVLTCKLNTGICQLCYGWNLGNGRMAELGETVGILAAQSIGEPGTQLTMRTFHTGGVFSSKVGKTILAPHEGRIIYNITANGKKVFTKYNEKAYFTLKEKKIKIVKNKSRQSIIHVPAQTLILKRPSENVREKEIIAEVHTDSFKKFDKKKFNKETVEIKANITGEIVSNKKYLNILSGNLISTKNLFSRMRKTYFITKNHFIIRHKSNSNTKIGLEHLIMLGNKERIQTILYPLQQKNAKIFLTKKKETEKIIYIKEKSNSEVGNILKQGKLKTSIEISSYPSQIIEKRKNLLTLRKAEIYSSKQIIKNFDLSLIKKNRILFNMKKKSVKTTDIVQGLPKIEQLLENKKTINLKKLLNNPQEKVVKYNEQLQEIYTNKVAVRKSIEKIQNYFINEIQKVYQSQGVTISNKHIEIIVKQMTCNVIIKEAGDSNLLIGELINLNKVEKLNKKLIKKIKYEPVIIGISKFSLNNQSFISEASFQETTKVIIRAALKGRIDWLYGLKENIVLSNLIPAGTSFNR